MRNILKQCDREKAINELVRGQRLAKRLKTRLQGWESASTTVPEPTPPPPFEEAGDVVIIKKLLTCFENTLCILKNSSSSSSSGHDDERRRKCQEHSGSSSTSTGLAKERRGCYKRFRKTDESWIEDNSMPVDDGHRWRKYGQKSILNSKYQRDYFRCTHKYDQGCTANKHVQRVAENPALYRTTYFGHHTCNQLLTASQFLPQEDYTAPFSLINFAPQPSSSSNNNKSGSSNGSNSSSSSNSNSNSNSSNNSRSSSSNDNNNTWSSFFTFSQSSTQQEYNNMNSDRDLPNHDRLISTYNKSPSLSHYLVPTYDQTDVLCTTSSTTTPILKNIGFDDNGRLLFYF